MSTRLAYQTKLGTEVGNCTEACIATLLGCPIEDVIDLSEHSTDVESDDHWFDALDDWLKEEHEYALVLVPADGAHLGLGEGTVIMASGTSARGAQHMVLMEGEDLYHDPHPEGEGLEEIDYFWLLVRHMVY